MERYILSSLCVCARDQTQILYMPLKYSTAALPLNPSGFFGGDHMYL